MANVIVPESAQLLQMADLKAGELTGATLHLSSADITPSKSTVKADLTECTFPNYSASAAITWGAVNQNEDGLAQIVGDAKTFQRTGAGASQWAYCAFILSAGAGTPLLACWRLDEPKEFATDLDSKTILPAFTYGSQFG